MFKYIYIYPYLTPWFIFRSYWFLTNTHAVLWQQHSLQLQCCCKLFPCCKSPIFFLVSLRVWLRKIGEGSEVVFGNLFFESPCPCKGNNWRAWLPYKGLTKALHKPYIDLTQPKTIIFHQFLILFKQEARQRPYIGLIQALHRPYIAKNQHFHPFLILFNGIFH